MPTMQRKARVIEKQRTVLRFLREEIWADVANFADLLQLKPAAATRTLAKLAQAGLIRKFLVPTIGGHVLLFGITSHGQGMAADAGEEILDKVFVPSRVAPTYARHTLDVQRLRIRAERAGWRDWINADRIEKWTTGQIRPDAFATAPDGKRFAIECERTIKTPKRYVEILNGWLQAIRKAEVEHVVWVSPDTHLRDRLKQMVMGITHVHISGQMVLIPRERFTNLSFLTYQDWPV